MSGETAAAPAAPAPEAPKNGAAPTTPQAPQQQAAPKATDAAPPKWQPVRTKLTFGDGTAEEVEFADEETLQRRLIAAKGFDRAQKRALHLEREANARREAIKVGNLEALKADGFDAEAYFVRRLEEEARRAGLSAQERAADDAQKRIAAAEQRAQASEARLRQRLEAEADTQAWADLEPRLQKAMDAAGMLGDTHAMESIERVAQEFLAAGLNVPPEQVVAEAAERDNAQFRSRLMGLPAQKLWTALPEERRRELMAIGVAEWKALKGVPVAAPRPPAPAAPVAPREYRTPAEYQAELRARLAGKK